MTRPWGRRDKALLVVLHALLWVVRVLPKPFFRPLAAVLGTLVVLASDKELKRLRTNVHRILGLPPGTHFARMFEKQARRHQVICVLETLRAVQKPDQIHVEGFDELTRHVQAAESAGKGHIVVTAHLGSWELCAYFGAKAASKPFHVLAKPSRSDGFTRFLNGLRETMGVDVFWTDRKTLLRDMLKALRAGESVGFVMDQKPEGRVGPVVSFMGQQTEFVSGPATVSTKTGCAVISIFCVREGPFRYRILSQTLVPAGGHHLPERTSTQLMAAEIERVIRLYPEQWTWSYRRWRFEAVTSQSEPVKAASVPV